MRRSLLFIFSVPVIIACQTSAYLPASEFCNGYWRLHTLPGSAGKRVTGLADLPDGRLFAAVELEGLLVLGRVDPNDDLGHFTWTPVAGSPQLPTCLAVVGGEIWVGTSAAGIGILNPENGSWRTLSTRNTAIPSNSIVRITAAPGAVWVSTPRGAGRYLNNSWTVVNTSNGLQTNDVQDVVVRAVRPATTTWIATRNRLYSWAGNSATLITDTGACLINTGSRLVLDLDGHFWLGGIREEPDSGLDPTRPCRYDFGSLREGPTWSDFPKVAGALSGRYLYDMSVDYAGRVWMAFRGAAAVHDQGSWCVCNSNNSIRFNSIQASVAAVGEAVWFGTNVGSANKVSPNWTTIGPLGQFTAILLEGNDVWLGSRSEIVHSSGGGAYTELMEWPSSNRNVTAMVRDAAGTLWVGTEALGTEFDGVCAIAPGFQQCFAEGLPSPDIRALAFDVDGRLWVATAGGLALRTISYWLPFTMDTSPLDTNDLRALTVDLTGRVWIGTGDSGVFILDPQATGDAAWSHDTTANGLPSLAVVDLAMSPSGDIWAATTAGVAHKSQAAASWTVYNVANGALPDDAVLTVSIDPVGRVWVGTEGGLALKDGDDWRHFHVTGSSMLSDRVLALDATSEELWVVTRGNRIALRNQITAPIGDFPPEIDGFSPVFGPPLSTVTITGNHFDDRPEFNTVTFGPREAGENALPVPALVQSATTTELVVTVPALATSGKIKVVSHNLSVESAADFTVYPNINYLSSTCVGLGDKLLINGYGFFGAGGSAFAQVRIGAGPWRTLDVSVGDRQFPSQIKYHIRFGDRSGPVQVRLPDGTATGSPDNVMIGSVRVTNSRVHQGVEGEPLIWGKRTLVHLDLDADGCDTKVTRGQLYWKKKNGSMVPGSWAYVNFKGIKALPLIGDDLPDAIVGPDRGFQFVAEFLSARSGFSDFFPLSEFDGVHIVLINGATEVLSFDLPPSKFHFQDVGVGLKMICMAVVPDEDKLSFLCGPDCKDFWGRAMGGMANVARMFPQQDCRWFSGSDSWFGCTPIKIRWGLIDLDGDLPTDDYDRITHIVDDYLDPEDNEIGVALLDGRLKKDGSPGGKAPVDSLGSTCAVFNNGRVGSTWGQEVGHVVGLTDSDMQNHDDDNSHHSRYDEGRDHDDKGRAVPCEADLTFQQALADQRGPGNYVYLLDSGPPQQLAWGVMDRCGDMRPKSVMSYAQGKIGENAFLEPIEYQVVINEIADLEFRPLSTGGAGAGAGGEIRSSLRLKGNIGIAGTVVVTLSYFEESDKAFSRPEPDGDYRLQLRDVAGELVYDHPFELSFAAGHRDATPSSARFGLRVPFPESAARAELRHADELLWARNVSSQPPSASFISPAGGSYMAEDSVEVMWEAEDPDGDVLQFALDYSPDGGATWYRLPQYLMGDSFDWTPGFVPPSDSGRLRLRVSDGFHTRHVLSESFVLEAADPLAYIMQPGPDVTFTEGERIDLVARSITSDGPNAGSFAWQFDGAPVGDERSGEYILDEIGEHIVRVEVTSYGQTDSAEVTIIVLADYDGDGMPNDWELLYKLNPLDLMDARYDPDGDRLDNSMEYYLGTNPRDPDSDNDGSTDGDEFEAGSDPLNPDSRPPTEPVLLVGAEALRFTVPEGGPAPDAKSFWINNVGAGDLAWAAEHDAEWLEVDPLFGDAPTEVAFSVSPGGLKLGVYTDQVIFTAPGVLNSPRMVEVTLRVVEPAPPSPGVGPFLRGDCNGDEAIDISDAVCTLGWLFLGGATPGCIAATNTNGDTGADISDATYLLNHLFLGGPAPVAPYPECGIGTLPADEELGCVTPPKNCQQ